MKPSLSVLVPISNAETRLWALVGGLLDILPELTPRFDILLIDDGSSDGSWELAHELAMLYPQVNTARHARRLGRSACMRSGLSQSAAEYVLYRDMDCRVQLDEIARMWRLCLAYDVVLGRVQEETPLGAIPRRPAAARIEPSLQLLHRKPLEAWRAANDGSSWLAYLILHGATFHELSLRMQRPSAAPVTVSRMPPRPKFIDRVRAFALGE